MKALLMAAVAITLTQPALANEQVSPAQASTQPNPGDAPRDNDDSSRASPDATQQGDNPDRVICRRQEVVGTRLAKKRVCATAAEWERIHADERQATERIQNQRSKSN
ncbi:hypothetical protein FSZ31_02035 [Sphingorhabdus soli]|uniref:Secreted protein n=1 Tax=Flavisphingopyxis soli TaxID=2601267 RepID=A0A5C6UM15_9SPHN|nr:hypothetical protein [Sphingorhabdus soli]TXC73550.1 hypothetical protein FSZ31_02035 [Sphingorhabdus soli]